MFCWLSLPLAGSLRIFRKHPKTLQIELFSIETTSNLPLRLRLTFRSVIAQPIFHFTQSQAQNTAYSRDEEGGQEGGGTKGNVIPSPVGAWGP